MFYKLIHRFFPSVAIYQCTGTHVHFHNPLQNNHNTQQNKNAIIYRVSSRWPFVCLLSAVFVSKSRQGIAADYPFSSFEISPLRNSPSLVDVLGAEQTWGKKRNGTGEILSSLTAAHSQSTVLSWESGLLTKRGYPSLPSSIQGHQDLP